MRLADYLCADFVLSHLEGRDVESVVREVSARAATAGVGSEDVIAGKLLERERAHSTVIGAGLAVPHATVPGLDDPVIGIAFAREPVTFGPEASEPVRVFFVLLSPPGREREHVRLLARICRLGRSERFLERLERTDTDEDIVRVVESIDAQHV
jgi:mannitol/fructose-specific phosphotransferase system IIA component (Ntr-type)